MPNKIKKKQFTKRSSTKRNLLKRNKLTRKYKKRKSTNMQQTRLKKKYLGGGDWIVNNNVPDEDICPICHEKFSETPERAIYQTTCKHVFHNNCLNEICVRSEKDDINPTCPICRTELGNNQCTDLWAFKENVLDTSDLKPEIKAIYDRQEDNEK